MVEPNIRKTNQEFKKGHYWLAWTIQGPEGLIRGMATSEGQAKKDAAKELKRAVKAAEKRT